MSHNTRSRRALEALATEIAGKTNTKSTTAGSKITKEKVEPKVRCTLKKNSEHKENAVPPEQVEKASVKKKLKPKASVVSSKLHSGKENKSTGDAVLVLKSPALRDRTNTASKMANEKEVEVSAKKSNEVKSKAAQTHESKRNSKKSEKIDEVVLSEVTSDNHVAKVPIVSSQKCSTKEIEDMLNNDQEIKIKPKTVDKKVVKDAKVYIKKVDTKFKENDKTNSKKNSVLRKKIMSMKEVEDLLNDDEIKTNIKNDTLKNKRKAKDVELSDDEDNNQKIQKSDKDFHDLEKKSTVKIKSEGIQKNKFFKHKHVEANTKSTASPTRPRRHAIKKKTKIDDDESDIDVIMEAEKEPVEPVKKNLRYKSTKNYCELSQVSQSPVNAKTSEDQKKIEQKNEKDEKSHLPIYKKFRLSQEKVKDKEEIYEYPDDSQDKRQPNKKRKRIIRKATIRRPRKAGNLKVLKKKQKKTADKIPKYIQFNVEDKKMQQAENIKINNLQCKSNVDRIPLNNESVEDFPNIENTVDKKIPAIKIISAERLDRSRRINLMTTPSVPKTITSELKLFGPKNAITSKPTSTYNNMINHSLIRQSMSPITKTDPDFDIGSPWRPTEAFSRVKKVVQSTPQIATRPILSRERKIPVIPIHLSEKSINSADTIHLSANNKSNDKDKSDTEKNQTSPRKFGSVISNTSPVQSKSVENIYEAKTIIHSIKKSPSQAISMQTIVDNNDLQSPSKAISPPSTFLESPKDVHVPEVSTKENVLQTSQKKNKFSVPSPFRFEKIRNSTKLASTEKQEPSKLKQTNLNAFLNLVNMPESTTISTAHGIFDDIPTPLKNTKNLKKSNIVVSNKQNVEANIQNAFGFDDEESLDDIPIEPPPNSKFATKEDVEKSVKGKLFTNVRVKSTLPSKDSTSTAKKAFSKNVLDKNNKEKEMKKANFAEESDESSDFNESEEINKDINNTTNNDQELQKKDILNAVSFSDTFDVLSETGDLESKIPEEVPLFVDLEPVHFSKPPRRSYIKRKREVCFESSYENDNESDQDIEHKKPKYKKKKDNLSKEERKRMQEWVKSINKTFEEIDDFDLVVE